MITIREIGRRLRRFLLSQVEKLFNFIAPYLPHGTVPDQYSQAQPAPAQPPIREADPLLTTDNPAPHNRNTETNAVSYGGLVIKSKVQQGSPDISAKNIDETSSMRATKTNKPTSPKPFRGKYT